MRFLVTGATGFIGKNLVERLVQSDHEIFCTYRESSDTKYLEGIEKVTLLKCDINDSDGISAVMEKIAPEMVFHCAAAVMEKNESKLNMINAGGTYNICEGCLKNRVKRLVYISSVAVVSGNDKHCLKDDMPYRATNAYGRSKIKAEKTVLSFRKKGLKTAILRPGMVYGVGEPHMLYKIFDLISKRLLPLPLVPEIDSKIQLAHIDNVVEAILLASEKEEALDGTFLIVDKDTLTIRELLLSLYEYLEAGDPLILPSWLSKILLSVPGVRGFKTRLKNRTYDISRAQEILGYNPVVSTREGLKQTALEWKRRRGIRL